MWLSKYLGGLINNKLTNLDQQEMKVDAEETPPFPQRKTAAAAPVFIYYYYYFFFEYT